MIDLKQVQSEIDEFWKKNKIYYKLMNRKGKKFFMLEGPPYANFIPHVGHIKNTVFKDMIIRLYFMKGYNVLFQPGFDTHGLPIENMVEKKLGLTTKKDIEAFGIGKFMKECKENAAVNKDLWMRVYGKLGSLYQLKEPYLTYENYYIQSGWWAFSKMYEKDMVYEGEKPVMWCPHCQTSLAGYEVTDSYKDVTDPGVYVMFKLKGGVGKKKGDEYILVYTTTPWTLPANVAIAIAPEEDYVLVELSGAGKKIIIGEKRLEKLSELGFGYSVIEKFKGEKLVGMRYESLLDVPLQKELEKGKLGRAHEIVASISMLKERVASKIKTKKAVGDSKDLYEEFVTMSEGTGFVHVAPGHGKTDFIVGQHYKLACVSPVDESCNFTKESGFSGFVKKADKEIMEVLKREEKLLYSESITHSYPLCWRCKSPLIFRLSKQLFFSVDKVKGVMQKENKKVDWMPKFSGERFDNWIENAEDWNISRQRYWGIPIPLWKCSKCDEEKIISSKEELEKASGEKIKDLHSVEEVSFKCKKCKSEMKKFPGILDVWFDSGVAPWASLGYPYQNKKIFEEHFPVDRINEAQDQIRGWFYSLMFCSAAVFGKAPYKAVSMTGWVLDKKGDKMSKSLGNVINAEDALDDMGADIVRYYFCWDIAPYEIQKFNVDIAKKEIGRVLNVLWNLKNLTSNKKLNLKDPEDMWIISRLNSVMKNYSKDIETFELQNALRGISEFILDDLSRKYIQMTREKDNSAVVTYCLVNILKLLAPVSPFITEKIWQGLKTQGIVKEESVHLSSWPDYEEKRIDIKLEEEFSEIIKIIELGLAERDKHKIGLKWPLSKALVYCKKKISKQAVEIIKEQLNVKKVDFVVSDEEKVELDITMSEELEAEGYARNLSRHIQGMRKKAGMVKENFIELIINADKKIVSLIKSQEDFIKERTNAKKITLTNENIKNNDYVFESIDIKSNLVNVYIKKVK